MINSEIEYSCRENFIYYNLQYSLRNIFYFKCNFFYFNSLLKEILQLCSSWREKEKGGMKLSFEEKKNIPFRKTLRFLHYFSRATNESIKFVEIVDTPRMQIVLGTHFSRVALKCARIANVRPRLCAQLITDVIVIPRRIHGIPVDLGQGLNRIRLDPTGDRFAYPETKVRHAIARLNNVKLLTKFPHHLFEKGNGFCE